MRSEIIDVFGPRTEGLLRAGDELWGRLLKGMFYVLRVARDGREILSEGPPPGSGLGPVRARRLWWYPGRGFAIEHVVTDDGTLVHRCHLNGPLHRQWVPAGHEPAPAPPGFVSIDAWDVEPFGRVHRQYLRMDDGAYNIWVISIQGAEVRTSGGPGKAWHADGQVEACADPRGGACARAEQLISARLADGFALRLIDFLNVDLEMLEDEHPGLGYGQARPFHGGWGRTGYLFDTRSVTTTGEHAIAPLTPPIDAAMASRSVWLGARCTTSSRSSSRPPPSLSGAPSRPAPVPAPAHFVVERAQGLAHAQRDDGPDATWEGRRPIAAAARRRRQ